MTDLVNVEYECNRRYKHSLPGQVMWENKSYFDCLLPAETYLLE